MPASDRLNVLLVDDHPQLRRGVRVGLEASAPLRVIGEAGSAEEALASIAILPPDVAVIDYQMPGIDGIELVAMLRRQGCNAPVVLLSANRERSVIERCFAVGANAFVAKESDLDVLVAALEAVVAGRRFVDPSVAAELLDDRDHCLTRRESEVLELMSDGLQNKEIARELILSEETVKTHVSSIMRKLDATSRTQAVGKAFRSGAVM